MKSACEQVPAQPIASAKPDGDATDRRAFGRSAKTGSAWALGQVLVSKCASLVGSVVTSWLLMPEELGLATLAVAAVIFAALFRPNVLADILIRDVRSCEALTAAARRLVWASTICTIVLTVALAPLIARFYGESALAWLMPIAALRAVASAIGVDALARLRLQLRFREMSTAAALETLVTQLTTIAMAAAGLGPLAILLGQILGLASAGLRYRALAPAPARSDADPGVGTLIRPFLLLNAAGWIHTVTVVAATLSLGLVLDAEAVGLFSFAAALAAQMNTLLAHNVGLVLQPIFGHLQQDVERQTRGFLRACAGIAAIAAPAFVAQAAVARPMLDIVFAERWLPSLRALEILLIAQFFAFATGPAMSLLKSQGRYRAILLWQVAQVIVVVALVILLSSRYGLVGAAIAVLVQHLVFGPFGVLIAARAGGVGLGTILRLYATPLVPAIAIFGPLWLLASWLGAGPVADVATLVAIPLVGGALYLLVLRRIQPEVARELLGMFDLLRSKLRRRPSAPRETVS